VYHGGDALLKLQAATYELFLPANSLHPDAFPAVRKMEAELVAMTLSLFNAHEACVGSVTSGGTESILLAIKTYRDYARTTRGVTEPELVVPTTAHAAFYKGAQRSYRHPVGQHHMYGQHPTTMHRAVYTMDGVRQARAFVVRCTALTEQWFTHRAPAPTV
jgi:sphinganine-1-phosphate aldolase